MPSQERKVFDFFSEYAISEYPDMHFIVNIENNRALVALFIAMSLPLYKIIMGPGFSGTRFISTERGDRINFIATANGCGIQNATMPIKRIVDTDLRNIDNRYECRALCILGLDVTIETIHESGARYKKVIYFAPDGWTETHKNFAIPGNVSICEMSIDPAYDINAVRGALYNDCVFMSHIMLHNIINREGRDIEKEAFMKYLKDGPKKYLRNSVDENAVPAYYSEDEDILDMMERNHGKMLQKEEDGTIEVSDAGQFLENLGRMCFYESPESMAEILESIKIAVINKERYQAPAH